MSFFFFFASTIISFFLFVDIVSIKKSFINDSDRIARRDYQPTDDDVIRARLRTLGVQEYKFIFDHGACVSINQSMVSLLSPNLIFFCFSQPPPPGRTMGQEWRLYDVGGARNTVRLFLKPLSFHQKKRKNITPIHGIREEHGIPTLMMVRTKQEKRNYNHQKTYTLIYDFFFFYIIFTHTTTTVDAIIFLA